MRKKITVVGAGNVGANCAMWIAGKELADVAFSLNAGELSGIIDTPEAIYVMLVEDKRTSHVRPLTEIRDEIERQLRAEEQARLRKLYVERLRKKTFVLYF